MEKIGTARVDSESQIQHYSKENVESSHKIDEERVRKLKAQLLDAPQKLDTERLKFMIESYRETEGSPAVIKRAKLFEKVLKNKTLYVDQNFFVGSIAATPSGIYPYPEWNVEWMKESKKAISHLGEVAISDEDLKLFREIVEYWGERCLWSRSNKTFEEQYGYSPIPCQNVGVFYDGNSWPAGGGNMDYNMVLTKGVGGMIKDVEKRMKDLALSNLDSQNEKRLFYQAVLIELRAVIHLAHRYADLSRKMASRENNVFRRQELLEIAEICEWVPENPPRTFREALQSFWFTHVCLEIEQCGCGYSLGYLGQIFEPFYLKDKQAGRISKEKAIYLLKMLFIKNQEIGYYHGPKFSKAWSSHTGQTICIGGLTPNGKDATAEVDYLMLEAQTELKNIQPTFALIFHDNLKEDFLLKAVDLVRTGLGQPQFMNSNVLVQRALDRFGSDGATVEEARRVAVFGCVGTDIAGKCAHPIEGEVCAAKAFELAFNDGIDPLTKQQIGPKTGRAESFTTFEELFNAFRIQMDFAMAICRNHGIIGNMLAAEFLPLPLRSSLTEGCIENGKDGWAGGAKYSSSLLIVVGGVDAANSLAAVKKLVFEEKRLTTEELKSALDANFEGSEKIKKMCLDAPKHGNDDDEMNSLVRRVYEVVYQSYYNAGLDYLGKKGKPDAYSNSLHNLFGSTMGALPSGREARRALTDGSVSAMPGSDKNGPTALANSAAKALDTVAYNSNHFNMKFHPSTLEGAKAARNLISLIKGYMDKGGSHIQFNCVSADTLKDAQSKPEAHKDLVIRVAGFSAYFTRLDKGVQDEIIKRTELSFH